MNYKTINNFGIGLSKLSILLLFSIFLLSCDGGGSDNSSNTSIQQFTYEILNSFPHDTNAFTQGLAYDDTFIFEGTGLFGQSSVRRADLETGNVLQSIELDDQFFGEGITVYKDKIIQLTLNSNTGFVYDRETFEQIDDFSYPGQGWGITHDGTNLIMSNGTSTLRFLDPETFEEIDSLQVLDQDGEIVNGLRLNELEFVNGQIFANDFPTDMIAIISPQTGRITGWIDLTGLFIERMDINDVTNGIAYDEEGGRLFVTGKRWPEIFHIDLVEQN